jgi:uncharacterized membrane protein
MTGLRILLAASAPARDAAYDLVLLAHVLAVLVGLGAVVVAGGYAVALGRSRPPSDAVRRYYRDGVNWAGRVLFLVPVLGVVLIAMSHGQWSYSDSWVQIGLALWAAAAATGEMILWPAERRLQAAVADAQGSPDVGPTCRRVVILSVVLCITLVVAVVVMVAKP